MALTKITNAVIADNAITLSKMADNSVGTSELVADAVTAVKIDDDGTGFTLGSIVVDTTTMVVDAPNNKVGIGTASPGAVCTQSTLEIKAAAAFLGLHCDGADPNTSSGIEFGDSSDGNIGQIHYWHGDNSMNFATNTLNALTLKSDQSAIFAGSVGIGTTSPQTELTVKTATNRNISFAGGGDIATGVCIMGTNDANSANIPLEFRGSVNCFTTGSVGIGISNPSKLLHLSTDTDDTNLYLDTHHNTPSAHPNIIFRKSTGTKASLGNVADDNSLGEIEWTAYHTDWEKAAAIHVEIDGTPSSIAKPAAMVFTTRDVTSNNLTERMRITSAGRVGIGTASPSHTVSISELSSGDACLSLSPTTGSNNSYMLISNSGGSARIGLERSLGGGLWTGSSAYSMIIGTLGARQVHIGTSETTAITIDTSQNTTFSGGVAINSGSANKITHNHGSTALEIENQGSKRALYVHSNVDGGQDNPLVEIKADNPAFDQEVLRIHNDGANHSLQVLDDGSEVFSIASGGTVSIAQALALDALNITKSANGNAINITHTGTQNIIHIDNNSESGNACVYVENTGSRGYAYYAYSNQGSNQGDPLVEFNSANAAFDRPTLKLQQRGTVEALEIIAGSTSNSIKAALTLKKEKTDGVGGDDAGVAIDFLGENADGGTYQNTSRIAGYVKNAIGGSQFEGGLKFYTVTDGYTFREALSIDSSQHSWFNGNLNVYRGSTHANAYITSGATSQARLYWGDTADAGETELTYYNGDGSNATQRLGLRLNGEEAMAWVKSSRNSTLGHGVNQTIYSGLDSGVYIVSASAADDNSTYGMWIVVRANSGGLFSETSLYSNDMDLATSGTSDLVLSQWSGQTCDTYWNIVRFLAT